jgi:hypothetical protein
MGLALFRLEPAGQPENHDDLQSGRECQHGVRSGGLPIFDNVAHDFSGVYGNLIATFKERDLTI